MPAPVPPTPQPYLHVIIHRPGSEWIWLISQIIHAVPEAQPGRDTVAGMDEKGVMHFYLLRERFPAALIGNKLGVAADIIDREEVITLWPLANPKEFPEPTVDYWGHA